MLVRGRARQSSRAGEARWYRERLSFRPRVDDPSARGREDFLFLEGRMAIAKRYNPQEAEPAWQARWQAQGTYRFAEDDPRPVYSIDTPPPTVSGNLHLGHTYSYSHADFMARFFRMRGCNVFYPMGFDDNGLPTERLVEKRLKINARTAGRQKFVEACLA